MSYSKGASSRPGGIGTGRSSQKSIARNFLGRAAVGCLVLGSAWTVYANIFSADVYPHLDGASFDAPIVKRSASIAVRKPRSDINESFAMLVQQQSLASASGTVSQGPSLSFDQRFAAASAQAVDPKPPQPELPKLAAAPKPQRETARLAETAPKPKEAAPAPVRVAALPSQPEAPAEVRTDKSPGATLRDMAQRAKAAVMSLASNERQSVVEKLWGKQPSNGPLLSYASADTSFTGSLGQNPNPALGGSAPYDRSTAVYDISAHAVYLPDGTTLEAHSGYGSELDDPRSAKVRMRGVTPPHIYELKPRETLFHGVPALRLTPVGGEDAIFGRTGLLAHTYMLGPNGDSNGCVSFKDYNAFLNAYRNQGIKKLAVVARLD